MKRKSLVFILTIVALCSIILDLTAATRYSNDLVRYVAKVKNRIPSRYTAPTELQVAIFREIIRHILNSEFADAIQKATALNYKLTAFTHTDNHIYYILESEYPKLRPWGTYIFYLGGGITADDAIEIPHPASEKNVAVIGIKLMIQLLTQTTNQTRTIAYLLSGSSRGKCDVAYAPGTIFQAVHEEISSPTTEIVQIHSFKIYSYPQIVITSGTSLTPAAMSKYIKFFIEYFNVGVYNGTQYVKVASTGNLQALYTNGIGGDFIGIFINRIVAQSKRYKTKFLDLSEKAISESTLTETTQAETTAS